VTAHDPILQHTETRLEAAVDEVLNVLERLQLPLTPAQLDALIPTLTSGRKRTAQLGMMALLYLHQAHGRLEDGHRVAAVSSALIAGAYVEALASGFHARAGQARGGRARGAAHQPFRAWVRAAAVDIRNEAKSRQLSARSVAPIIKRRFPRETEGRSIESMRKILGRW